MDDAQIIRRLRADLSQAVRQHNHHRRKSAAAKIARNRIKQGMDYWRERALKAEGAVSAETFVIHNQNGSISLDPYHGMTREELKRHCQELCMALDEWRFHAMSAATSGGNKLENVPEHHRDPIARMIEAFSD